MYLHNFKLKIMKKRYQKDGNAYLTFKNASFQSPELWPVCAHFAHTIPLWLCWQSLKKFLGHQILDPLVVGLK